jgi:hypothetical protein
MTHLACWYRDDQPTAMLVHENFKTELLSSKISLQFDANRRSISKFLQNVIVVRQQTKIVVTDMLHHTFCILNCNNE